MTDFAVKFMVPMFVYIEADDEAEARRIFEDPQTDDENDMLVEFRDDEEAAHVPLVITSVVNLDN